MTMNTDPSWTRAMGDESATNPQYSNAVDWLELWLLPNFHRSTHSEVQWCERWWAHPEAVVTIEALWRSWEHVQSKARHQEAEWLLRTLHPLMDRLTGQHSPFEGCQPERSNGPHLPTSLSAHRPLQRQLPVLAAPATLQEAHHG